MIKFERTLTDEEESILNHDLLDIIAWINGMIDGKINNCAKRAALEYRGKAAELGLTTIPVDSKVCALSLFECKDYKSRIDREVK